MHSVNKGCDLCSLWLIIYLFQPQVSFSLTLSLSVLLLLVRMPGWRRWRSASFLSPDVLCCVFALLENFFTRKNLSFTSFLTQLTLGKLGISRKWSKAGRMIFFFWIHTGFLFSFCDTIASVYKVSTSLLYKASFYHLAELPKRILSSFCHQSGKIRLIRDGVMLALHTIKGRHSELLRESENHTATKNKRCLNVASYGDDECTIY